MEIILGDRGSGKSTELIKKSVKNGYVIVCANRVQVKYLEECAKRMGLEILKPITYTEFINSEYVGREIKGFLIDQVDMLLQQMSPFVEIKSITMTK